LLLKDVSQRSEVNVIAATRFWLDIPRIFWDADLDKVAQLFIREIEKGIEGTGIRANIIKVGSNNRVEDGLTLPAEIVLRVAARTGNHTSVPTTTHMSAPGSTGDLQVEVF